MSPSSGALYLDRSRPRPARRPSDVRDQHAKPAYALAGLFAFYYLLGSVIANWQLALAVAVPVAVAIWLLAVLADALDLPIVDRWRLRSARIRMRREARGR